MRYLIVLLFSIFSSHCFSKDNAKVHLIVSYGIHNSPPYVINIEHQLGILPEIAKELAQKIDIPFKLIDIPRRRTLDFLKRGKTHLYCSFNKGWTDRDEDFYWVEDLFTDSNVVVERQDKTKQEKSSQKIVGVISGYRYHPKIEKLWKSGEYEKQHFKTYDQMFQFYREARLSRLISSKNIYTYYKTVKKIKVEGKMIKDLEDTHQIGCVVSKASPIAFKKIETALLQMKEEGFFNRLLKKYR